MKKWWWRDVIKYFRKIFRISNSGNNCYIGAKTSDAQGYNENNYNFPSQIQLLTHHFASFNLDKKIFIENNVVWNWKHVSKLVLLEINFKDVKILHWKGCCFHINIDWLGGREGKGRSLQQSSFEYFWTNSEMCFLLFSHEHFSRSYKNHTSHYRNICHKKERECVVKDLKSRKKRK